jgi:AcrR family transcriptional regulator
MTTTPDRILRAKAQSRDPSHFALTERQRQRHERVIAISQYLIAEEGRHNINFRGLARALRMTPATLRFHFVDMEALLAEIIRRHLRLLAAALGTYEPTDPERHQKRRATYLAYTRTPLGGLTEAHLILVRDRHTLPDDERISIDMMRQGLGALLGGEIPEETLLLLDAPFLDAPAIEARLAPPPLHAPKPLPQIMQPQQPVPQPEPAGEPNAWTHPGEGEKPGNWIFSAGIPTSHRPPLLTAVPGRADQRSAIRQLS